MEHSDSILKLYQLPNIDANILNSTFDITISEFNAQPLCSLGFNYYFHQSYEKFNNILLSQKTEYYWIVSGYEVILSDTDRKYELINMTEKYFKKSNDCFKSVIFYKFWDIFMHTTIIENYEVHIICDDKNKNYIYSTLELFTNNSNIKKKINIVDIDYNFCIIYLDYNFNTINAESEYFNNIVIYTFEGLSKLKNNGTLIINIGDMFTLPTIKFLMLLNCIFYNIFIYKPYYSRAIDSEKYILCKKFNKEQYNSISKKFSKCTQLIKNLKNQFVIDFMADNPQVKEFDIFITYVNLFISGNQHKEKNKIISYIESENYYGADYQKYINNQLMCVEYFTSNFYPITQEDFNKILIKNNNSLSKNNDFIINFQKTKILSYTK